MQEFEVIVLGAGPGGEGAAMQAVKRDHKVCVVERQRQVGGGCTHWGTIPSKALRHAVGRLMEVRTNPLLGPWASGWMCPSHGCSKPLRG